MTSNDPVIPENYTNDASSGVTLGVVTIASGEVLTNNSRINGGTYNGMVLIGGAGSTYQAPSIYNGTFNGTVNFKNGNLYGGEFNGTVSGGYGGTIDDTCSGGRSIRGTGVFDDSIEGAMYVNTTPQCIDVSQGLSVLIPVYNMSNWPLTGSPSSTVCTALGRVLGRAEDNQTMCVPIFNWTGAVNTSWDNAANWQEAKVPQPFSKVIIPNVTNLPEIPSTYSQSLCHGAFCSTVALGDVEIATGATLTINTNVRLGDFYGNVILGPQSRLEGYSNCYYLRFFGNVTNQSMLSMKNISFNGFVDSSSISMVTTGNLCGSGTIDLGGSRSLTAGGSGVYGANAVDLWGGGYWTLTIVGTFYLLDGTIEQAQGTCPGGKVFNTNGLWDTNTSIGYDICGLN